MNAAQFGLSGFAVYVPPYRVDLQQWCGWTGNVWDKVRNVIGTGFRIPGVEQDVYTMAAQATLDLILRYRIDPARVGYLALGTESSMDNATGAVIVRGLVDRALAARGLPRLARDCEVPELKQACLGGVYGIKGALRYLSYDGAGRQAIVVASDIAEYARGSTGEPTQGAGAVAMLLEADPQLLAIDLTAAASASSFRMLDFRKPFARFAGQPVPANGRLRDFPVFNGKYSTAAYVDETLVALDQLLSKRGGARADYFRHLEAVFMHRPYHRMPHAALALAYLFALGADGHTERAELEAYCAQAGVDVNAVLAEMATIDTRAHQADFNEQLAEPYPLCAALSKVLRDSPRYRQVVDDKMQLGSARMMEAGNLYSAALPAWVAAGFDEAVNSGHDLAGRELLLVGYGSGDAAEAIPARVAANWKVAAARIGLDAVLAGAIDLTQAQYEALHDGVDAPNLKVANEGFRIERVGSRNSGSVHDFGVAYYAVPASIG